MEKGAYKMKDYAYQQIRQMIISGQLVPGQKITENALMTQLKMGRTPVREAILALAHEQLIQIHPRKYIEIASVSPEKVNEIFELRICLEPSVLRRHAASIDLVKLLELKQRITDNIKMYESSTMPGSGAEKKIDIPYPQDVVSADEDFHALLIGAAGNSQISLVFSTFMDYVSLLWAVNSRLVASRALQSDKEHLQIIDAILDNKVDEASQLLARHLELSRNALIHGMLQKWNNPMTGHEIHQHAVTTQFPSNPALFTE